MTGKKFLGLLVTGGRRSWPPSLMLGSHIDNSFDPAAAHYVIGGRQQQLRRDSECLVRPTWRLVWAARGDSSLAANHRESPANCPGAGTGDY